MLFLGGKNNLKSYSSKALSLIRWQKRAAFPFSSFLKGGMTFEGCLVLPLFLFCMGTLLYGIEIVRFQSDAWEAMHQAGSRSCLLSCEAAGDTVMEYLDRQLLPYLCVKQGRRGVHVIENKEKNGEIELTVSYQIRPFLFRFPIGNISASDSFYGHDFKGYRGGGFAGENTETEKYVYVTETGSKYHFSENCTYLRVTVQAVRSGELSDKRNTSGEKYDSCERCKPAGRGMVYLTEWGNRYHESPNCSALKRNVFVIPLSCRGNRTACSKCG